MLQQARFLFILSSTCPLAPSSQNMRMQYRAPTWKHTNLVSLSLCSIAKEAFLNDLTDPDDVRVYVVSFCGDSRHQHQRHPATHLLGDCFPPLVFYLHLPLSCVFAGVTVMTENAVCDSRNDALLRRRSMNTVSVLWNKRENPFRKTTTIIDRVRKLIITLAIIYSWMWLSGYEWSWTILFHPLL